MGTCVKTSKTFKTPSLTALKYPLAEMTANQDGAWVSGGWGSWSTSKAKSCDMFWRLLACILSILILHTIYYIHNLHVKSLWLIHLDSNWHKSMVEYWLLLLVLPFYPLPFIRWNPLDAWGLSDCCCAVGWRTHEGWHSLVHCRIVLVEGNDWKQKILYQLTTGSYTHWTLEWMIYSCKIRNLQSHSWTKDDKFNLKSHHLQSMSLPRTHPKFCWTQLWTLARHWKQQRLV